MAEDIMFSVGVDTGNTAQDMNKIDKSISQVDSSVEDLNEDIKKTSKSTDKWENELNKLNKIVKEEPINIRKMNKQIQEYQAIALSAGRQSAVGQKALKRAAELKDAYIDIQAETNRMANDHQALKGVMEIGQSTLAGYGAFKGTMALAGVESENLQKTLVKLQAVQTVLTGINQIKVALEKESNAMLLINNARTKTQIALQKTSNILTGKGNILQKAQIILTKGAGLAMKALNLIMKANPILLIVAAIAAVVAAFSIFSSATESAAEANEKLNATIDAQNKAFERNQARIKKSAENRRRELELAGATEEELHKDTLTRLAEEEKGRKQEIQNIKNFLDNRQRLHKKAIAEGDSDEAKAIHDQITADKKRIRELKLNRDEFDLAKREEIKRFNEFEQSEAKKAADKEKAEQKRRNDAWKKARDKRLAEEKAAAKKQQELEKLMVDLSIANIEDETTRAIAALGVKQQRERDALREKYGTNTELEAELKIKQANELQALEDKLAEDQKKKDDEKAAADLAIQNESDRAALEAKLLQIQGDFDAEQDLKLQLAQQERDQLLQNEQLTAEQRLLINEQYNAAVKQLNTERKESEEKTNEALITSRQQLLGAVAGVFGQLAGLAKEGSAAAKALALTEIGINTAVGFVNGLRIAQESAVAAGPGAAFAFPIFYATQIGAVLAAASKAKSILGSGSSVSAPSATGGGSSGASSPSNVSAFGIPENNETSTEDLLGNTSQAVLVVDSVTKVQNQSAQVQAVSTVS